MSDAVEEECLVSSDDGRTTRTSTPDVTVDESTDAERQATLRPLLRVAIAGLRLGPGVHKILTYEQSLSSASRRKPAGCRGSESVR